VKRIVALSVLLALAACKEERGATSGTPGTGTQGGKVEPAPAAGPPIELSILYGSEKKTWLEEQIAAFDAADVRIGDRRIHVTGKSVGSGEAMQAILGGAEKPVVFSPASGAYVTLLNEHWMIDGAHPRPIAPTGDPLVLSPIVIATWKPMAEALGWPGKPIGWSDILKVSRSPKGWADLGRAEWGAFKLGHTHPEYSNSGLLSALAIAYAGAEKTRGLSKSDLAAPAVKKFMEQVEDAIVHYGKSTGLFADQMVQRGATYLSAAVLYENLVIESYGKSPPPEMPLVAIYPEEGTFWSDHPYSVLDADWVTPEQKEAAAQFLAFLKAKPQQARAMALGFRPSEASIPIGAPIDAAHGVDPLQPQTLLEVPDGPTLTGLVALWRATKKASDVVLVFDKSGSMEGEPLRQAKEGAKAFLQTLDVRDRVSLMFFDTQVYPEVGPFLIGEKRGELESRIDGITADGGTSLYGAILSAHQELTDRLEKSPHRIHALVVMTDGEDDGTSTPLPKLLEAIGGERSAIQVFTIAYGAGAGHAVLTEIAETTKGVFAKGDPASIAAVFRDMGSFF